MFPTQPLTPQQIELLRLRMNSAQGELTHGGMPNNVGEGLQRLGTAIGYAAMRHRYNSQFPDAPGGGAGQQARAPIQVVAEALMNNRAPWQFPKAPAPASNSNPMAGSGRPRFGLGILGMLRR